MKTSLLVETHPHPSGHLVRCLLRIEGVPPACAPGERHRVPLNLSLVLDRSGSMAGGKLEAVQRAARDLVRRLHPDDRVSVVVFDDEVNTISPPGTAAEQPDLLRALMGIRPGGCTNLSGGWLQGRALAQVHHDPEGLNRVILLTDGLANQGITDPTTLRELCAQALQARVSTTTVGVGAGYDEELLASMAEAGGGCTYYIERLDQAGGVFEEELEGLLSIAAQNLTVRLQPRESAEITLVHHSYPAVSEADGGLRLSVGDLHAREPREVLADVVVASGKQAEGGGGGFASSGEVAVLDLVVEADVWAASGGLERRRVSLPVTFDPEAGAVGHPEVERVYALLKAADARREAVALGDRGDVAGAARTLREAGMMIAESGLDLAEAAPEIAELQLLADSMETHSEMSAMDRKFLYTKQQMMTKSRRSASRKLRRE